jgi:acetylornithine deacetylase
MKPRGVSAIEEFAPLLKALDRLNDESHRRFHHPLFEDPGNVAPISIGTVRAGDWPSTVPDLLVAEGRLGCFPDESVEEARARFSGALAAAAALSPWLAEHPPVVEWFEGQFESGSTDVEEPIVKAVAASHDAMTGAPTTIFGIPSGTDLRLFTRYAGIPTVMYGPGSVLQAHGTDEYVSIREMIICTAVLAQTMIDWCGA